MKVKQEEYDNAEIEICVTSSQMEVTVKLPDLTRKVTVPYSISNSLRMKALTDALDALHYWCVDPNG